MGTEIEAFALCWPNDPHFLLFQFQGTAEENRKWFSKNYKLDRNGNPRGEPFVVRLTGVPESKGAPWCQLHQHYKWCEHNGGVMGPNGWQGATGDSDAT